MRSESDVIAALGMMGIVLVVLLLIFAVNILICLLLQSCYKRIPQQFRKLEPGLVWLLLIPCFSLVWNFFVFPRLSQSFKSYFDSIGRTDVGDCSGNIGLAYAICCAVSVIPYLGCLTGIASLVLLIMYLVKANELKNQIPAA
jgi:hypothetical protein